MPVKRHSVSDGKSYYQWGDSGAKYYYTTGDESSREKAKKKAEKQAKAIYSSGYKGK
jgi:hypothetical protein